MVEQDITEDHRPSSMVGIDARVRAPKQGRGRERVEIILDAVAAVIAASGLAGVTMQAVAKQAHTSTGSMYHFFADREGLLQALAERHEGATDEINQKLHAIPAAVWRQLSPTDTIARLVTPYIEYMQRHADYLPLMNNRFSPKNNADFIIAIRNVLVVRIPFITPDKCQTYAVMLHAIAAGALQIGFQRAPERTDLYWREIPKILALYLADIEACTGK